MLSTSGVLRLPAFRLLLAGRTASVLGDRMVSVALAFAVLEVGGSASEVGLVLAAGNLPLVASVLVGGVVGDRSSRRAVMLGADLLRIVTQGATAALLIGGVAEVWMLATLAALTGIGTGFFNPASTALLPEVVPSGQLQEANALRSAALSASEIAGPLLAGVLVAAVGAGVAIAVDAATFAVSAVCLLLLRVPARELPPPASFLEDLRGGWAAFREQRWVWTFVLYFAIGNAMWAAWSALGPIVADRELGGPAAWGVVLAAIGVGALVGSLVATRVDPDRPLVVVAAMEGLFALPLAFLALGAHTALLTVGAFASGAGMMIGMSLWESTLQRHIRPDQLSRVSSYDWFGSYAFFPLGLVLWGPLASWVGLSAALWIAFASFSLFVVGLLAIPDTWTVRRNAGDAAAAAPLRTSPM